MAVGGRRCTDDTFCLLDMDHRESRTRGHSGGEEGLVCGVEWPCGTFVLYRPCAMSRSVDLRVTESKVGGTLCLLDASLPASEPPPLSTVTVYHTSLKKPSNRLLVLASSQRCLPGFLRVDTLGSSLPVARRGRACSTLSNGTPSGATFRRRAHPSAWQGAHGSATTIGCPFPREAAL